MSDSFYCPTSPDYSPPTSPAYTNWELPGEPYVPTSPEYHPTEKEPEAHLDSNRSSGSQRDSIQEARPHLGPEQGATVADRDSNQGSNDTTVGPVPPLRANVFAIIRGQQLRRRNGFCRLPAVQLQFQPEQQEDQCQREEELRVEAEQRVQRLSRINDNRFLP